MTAARKSAESKSDKGGLYVTAPLVSVSTKDGRVSHFYKGDLLPGDVTDESLENLQSLGYVSDEPQQ